MTAAGHEDPFPPRWLNVRCVIRHGTFVETNGNGRDAPEPDLCIGSYVVALSAPKTASDERQGRLLPLELSASVR